MGFLSRRPNQPPTVMVQAPPPAPPVRDPKATPPRWLTKYGVGAWLVIGLALFIWGIILVTTQVTMVFVAVFLALVATSVLWPIASFLDRWMPRPLATGLSIVGLFALSGALMYYVVYSVASQWDDLASQFSDGLEEIFTFIEDGPLPVDISRDQIDQAISDGIESATTYAQDNTGELASAVMSNAGALALVLTILALALFMTVFFTVSGNKMWLWFLNLLPSEKRERTHQAAVAGWYTFSGYARGTIIVALADGILSFALLIILGVPLAAPLAVLVFIGAFIPLIGAPAAMIIATIVALAAKGPLIALIVLVGIALVGQIEGNLLQPLVMGKQVSLHPVVVAVGVAAGTFAGGLLGAVIAIPILAVIWSVFKVLHKPDPPLEELPEEDPEELVGAKDD